MHVRFAQHGNAWKASTDNVSIIIVKLENAATTAAATTTTAVAEVVHDNNSSSSSSSSDVPASDGQLVYSVMYVTCSHYAYSVWLFFFATSNHTLISAEQAHE